MNTFKYLVYDIESVINKPLLNKVLFPAENLSDEEAYQKHLQELLKEDRTFVNPSFHKPVCIAAVAVAEDFSISRVGLLGDVPRTVRSLVTAFWDVYAKQPCLVDFNGKGYDIRLMELWAFQLGLTIHKKHFFQFGARYRFNDEHHIDLHDFLTNHGAIRFMGGLNMFSKLLGKPGKINVKGDMVQELFEQGELFRIEDYCLGDAMDTYFVFLRTRVMIGEITLEREQELVLAAKEILERKQKEEGFFYDYLAHFGEWKPEE